MILTAKAFTDIGMKRSHNEDNFLVLEEEQCFVVADGMGGHMAGETASKVAVDTIREMITSFRTELNAGKHQDKDAGEVFAEAIGLANINIHNLSMTAPQFAGMGTTVTGVLFNGDRAYIANVGDSRVYRLRGRKLKRLTEDHSLFSDFVKRNEATPEDEATFPYKNVITRALGVDSTVEVDIKQVKVQKGDLFLLCSDGLSGLVSDGRLEEMLNRFSNDLESAGAALIDEANMNGGDDNITVVLVLVQG